jgi:hypothetical protein
MRRWAGARLTDALLHSREAVGKTLGGVESSNRGSDRAGQRDSVGAYPSGAARGRAPPLWRSIAKPRRSGLSRQPRLLGAARVVPRRCSVCLDAVAGLPVDLRLAALPLIVVEAVGKTWGGVESSKGRLRPGPANGLSCA